MSWISRAPVAAATAAAARSAGPRVAAPPIRIAAGSPERSARAAASTAPSGTGAGGAGATGAAGPGAGDQPASAGRISVATPPDDAAAAASAASRAADRASRALRSQCDTGRATDSMSLASGAPSGAWCTAWSPTRLTSGVRALYALCRFANAFPSPGPRCSSVAAGTPVIRP